MDDIYDYLAAYIQDLDVNNKVLDVGAGEGVLGLYLREYEFKGRYLGIDKNPTMCKQMEKNGLRCEEGDLRWLDIRKNSWSVVVVKDVLEHLDNPTLLTQAILTASRYFILVTEALLIDSLMPPPKELHFCIDDLLKVAQGCKFNLHDYHRLGNHSILVFMRKRRKR